MSRHPIAAPLSLLVLTLLSPLALAEKADREKPVNLEADRVTVDDAKKVHIFDGNVTLIQGTLIIRGDRIVVTQDESGFQKGVATGNPARFKQKREGRDDYVEGIAQRIEHNAKSEKTELFEKAWVKSGEDEVKGHYIQYDSLTEQYLVTASKVAGEASPGVPAGRVRAIIQPKNQNGNPSKPQGATGSSSPLTLKPASSLPTQKE